MGCLACVHRKPPGKANTVVGDRVPLARSAIEGVECRFWFAQCRELLNQVNSLSDLVLWPRGRRFNTLGD